MRKRCEYVECKKALLLTSVICKCNKSFCSNHRSSYDHSCTYDYKNEHKSTLMKFMSTPIIADKLTERI